MLLGQMDDMMDGRSGKGSAIVIQPMLFVHIVFVRPIQKLAPLLLVRPLLLLSMPMTLVWGPKTTQAQVCYRMSQPCWASLQ